MKFLLALTRDVFKMHSRNPQNLLSTPVAIPDTPWAQRGREVLLRHGQGHGCGKGSGCGCVCDIQVSVDEQGVVTDAAFVAKRVLLGAGGDPVLTSGGELMLYECSCNTLKSIGSIATSICKGQLLEALRNSMLFSPAAPPAFLRTLSRNMGANPPLQPQQEQHQQGKLAGSASSSPLSSGLSPSSCLQIVEEALTTALTDRPYSLPTGVVATSGADANVGEGMVGGDGDQQHFYGYSTGLGGGGRADSINQVSGRVERREEVAILEEDEGLAEVDFRQQYDYA
ncbi:unnamed protein product [Choristocarpus tenellus]